MKRLPMIVGLMAATALSAALAQKVDKAGIPVTKMSTTEYTCNASFERCVIPVYVSTFKQGNLYFCDAEIEFGAIKVPTSSVQGKKIRIVWQLVERDVGDSSDYRFTPGRGIEFLAANDVTQDFSDPDEDSRDRRKFKWTSVHGRGVTLKYVPKVQRYDPAKDQWVQCGAKDPTISNL